jgi:hypothetical protein
MGGFSNAFWLWLPVLIYKAVSAFVRTIWKFNLWIIQTVCGVPLFYCKPEYRIPGIFIGLLGNLCMLAFILSFSTKENLTYKNLQMILVGAGFFLLCRFLIRRGSI